MGAVTVSFTRPSASAQSLATVRSSKRGSMPRFLAIIVVFSLTASTSAMAATKAIKFGKLWDGRRMLSNVVVVVDDDKITSVTANGRIPADAEVIDLQRFTGVPGMIDAHTHLTYYWDGAPGTTPRQ